MLGLLSAHVKTTTEDFVPSQPVPRVRIGLSNRTTGSTSAVVTSIQQTATQVQQPPQQPAAVQVPVKFLNSIGLLQKKFSSATLLPLFGFRTKNDSSVFAVLLGIQWVLLIGYY